MELSVDENLTLSNVASKIGNRMRDIFRELKLARVGWLHYEMLTIVRHGQNRNLRDRTIPALNPPSTLVDC